MLTAFVIAGFVLLAIVLFWADRTTSLVDTFRDVVVNTGRQIEAESGVNLVDRDDIPGTKDQIAHAAFWGSTAGVLAWLLRRRVPVALTGLFVAGASIMIELGQPRFSATRVVEPSDMVANLCGIAIAIPTVAILAAVERVMWGENRHYHLAA